MSINLNIPGFNPNTLSLMNPASNLTTGLGSTANSAQSGIMQTLSQLFTALSQMFSTGGQNGQFQANPGSLNFGNSVGQGSMMGNQGFNLGQSPVPTNFGNGNGQSQQPVNITINMGQPPAQGTRSIGTSSGNGTGNDSSQPMNAERAAGQVNKNFAQLDKNSDGVVDRNELQTAKSDSNLSSRTKEAANFLLNDQNAMTKVETADQKALGQTAQADGRISKGDTVAAMAQGNSAQPTGYKDAVAALKNNKQSIQDSDGNISKGTLTTIAETGRLPNGQPAPADLQKAAVYLTQTHPEKFDQLEDTSFYRSSNNKNIPKGDGKVGLQDLQTALGQ